MSSASAGRPGKRIPWRRDLVILKRLPEVERRHLAGESNVAIADRLGMAEVTVREDLKRLRELWAEQIADTQAALRARAIAELADVKRRAIAAAEWDLQAERAVLLDEEIDGQRIQRDDKDSATFRGQKAQALNVARQAVMDTAKLLGLVIEKQEHSGSLLVRRYIGVPLPGDARDD